MNLSDLNGGTPAAKPWLTPVVSSITALTGAFTSLTVAGVSNVTATGRFDATLSQTLYADDGILAITWDGVIREAKYVPTGNGFAGASQVCSNTYLSFNILAPTTATGTSTGIVAGVSYFVSSAKTTTTGTTVMDKFVPQVCHQQLYATNAPTIASVPYYDMTFMVPQTALGNFKITKTYVPA